MADAPNPPRRALQAFEALTFQTVALAADTFGLAAIMLCVFSFGAACALFYRAIWGTGDATPFTLAGVLSLLVGVLGGIVCKHALRATKVKQGVWGVSSEGVGEEREVVGLALQSASFARAVALLGLVLGACVAFALYALGAHV